MKRKIDWKRSCPMARFLWFFGYRDYKMSCSIAETFTYGWGQLDEYGFWEYPIYFIGVE